jgi:hypothetical protein
MFKQKSKHKWKYKVYMEDLFDRPHVRTLTMAGNDARKVYNQVKNENGVIDILDIQEVK